MINDITLTAIALTVTVVGVVVLLLLAHGISVFVKRMFKR